MEHITVTRDSTVKWRLDNVYPTSREQRERDEPDGGRDGERGECQTTATYGYDPLNRLAMA